jgi:DNA-binding Lrp family transcriptional regulator
MSVHPEFIRLSYVRRGMAGPISSLDEELLRVLRRAPDRTLSQLASDVGPRTNFGRVLTHRIREPVDRLVDTGLIEECRGHYRLSVAGRRVLGERAFEVGKSPE